MKQNVNAPLRLENRVPYIPDGIVLHSMSLQHPTGQSSLTCQGNTDAPYKIPLLLDDATFRRLPLPNTRLPTYRGCAYVCSESLSHPMPSSRPSYHSRRPGPRCSFPRRESSGLSCSQPLHILCRSYASDLQRNRYAHFRMQLGQ